MKTIVLLLLFLPFASFAQKNEFERYMTAEYKLDDGFNGSVLVAKNGNVVYQQAFGYRDPDQQHFLDVKAVFELASVSKQFTAMGILLLEQNGQLHLTDTLRQFFPELPYHKITIYQLLTHTAGLPDYLDEMDHKWNHKKIAFNKDMIAFLAAEKPKAHFKPGAHFEYSNTGYALLASIIEKVSGESYGSYLKKAIFKPLHLQSTTVYNTRRSLRDTLPDYAYGFIYSDALKKYVLPDSIQDQDMVYYLDGIVGDGCVNSNTADLLKWQNALNNNTLLKKENQVAMSSPHALMDTASNIYYGYGVTIGNDENGAYTAHSGSWPGYGTELMHYQRNDVTIIVLSNNNYNAGALAQALVKLAYNEPIVMPYEHKESVIDPALLNYYTGKYLIPQNNQTIELIKIGDKLYRHLPGHDAASDVELKPESPKKFFYNNRADVQLEFETNAAGEVLKTWAINNGVKFEIKKL